MVVSLSFLCVSTSSRMLSSPSLVWSLCVGAFAVTLRVPVSQAQASGPMGAFWVTVKAGFN